MRDLIYRETAIDALGEEPPVWYDGIDEISEQAQWRRDVEAIKALPPVDDIPCTFCRFSPPSSRDGKPCTMCPAEGRSDD